MVYRMGVFRVAFCAQTRGLTTLRNVFLFSWDIGGTGPGGNLNLLLAAAVAGVQTDDDNSSSDEERERDSLTLDKAMELWTKHKKRNGEALC